MAQPKTVSRTHDLTYQRITLFTLEGVPPVAGGHLYRVQESYKDKSLFHWYEDHEGTRLRRCKDEGCNHYALMSATKAGWKCSVCTSVENAEKQSEANKAEYKRLFEERVESACAAVRKQIPSAKIRKGRNRTDVVFDSSQGTEAAINAVFGGFNLKLGWPTSMKHANARYNRKQAEVRDINPFRRLEKTINGEDK